MIRNLLVLIWKLLVDLRLNRLPATLIMGLLQLLDTTQGVLVSNLICKDVLVPSTNLIWSLNLLFCLSFTYLLIKVKYIIFVKLDWWWWLYQNRLSLHFSTRNPISFISTRAWLSQLLKGTLLEYLHCWNSHWYWLILRRFSLSLALIGVDAFILNV